MKPRLFKTYDALRRKLERDGVEHAGVVATLLLQTFVMLKNKLYAVDVERVGLCRQGGFLHWREGLKEKGWIDTVGVGQYTQHTPGRKLVIYINKEILAQDQIATKASVDNLAAETRANFLRMARFFIEKYDPPLTDEKLAAAYKEIGSEERTDEFPG